MRSTRPSILIVEDDRNTREGLQKYLTDLSYEVKVSESAEEAVEQLSKLNPEIVITDLRLPKMNGMELLKLIKLRFPKMIVILLTAYGTIETAVEAMKAGAYDYLNKPVNLDELEQLIERASEFKDISEENQELKTTLKQTLDSGEMIYRSTQMKQLVDTAKRVAPSTASVLLLGESGTGKELFAQLIHDQSPRKNHNFIAVHCASLTESLLASELFGYEKGAFTGATERHIGRFERAHQGTLFLDEIGEIPESMQVKLLRVLQDGQFERVGGTTTIKSDIRLISATNKILAQEIKNGKFREDLFYRINVVTLEIPPLRDRKEDIAPLTEHFVKLFSKRYNKKITKTSGDVIRAFENYAWPGNVRELKNIVERMVVLSQHETLSLDEVPQDLQQTTSGQAVSSLSAHLNIRQAEEELIRSKLQDLKGNKSKAAQALGISRRTLYRKMEEYKLKK